MFLPDYVSKPGDTILDILEEKGLTYQDLGYSEKYFNDIVDGTILLSEEVAERLAKVLGSSVEFWLTRENLYRLRVR